MPSCAAGVRRTHGQCSADSEAALAQSSPTCGEKPRSSSRAVTLADGEGCVDNVMLARDASTPDILSGDSDDRATMGKGRSLLLTFDDGPEPGRALDSILTTLQRNHITSEFYVIGTEVAGNPEKAKLIVEQGHRIQNHSWSHINLAKAPESEVRSQLEKTQQVIREATGVVPTKVRPPYGAGGWPPKYDLELAKTAKALSLRIENWER